MCVCAVYARIESYLIYNNENSLISQSKIRIISNNRYFLNAADDFEANAIEIFWKYYRMITMNANYWHRNFVYVLHLAVLLAKRIDSRKKWNQKVSERRF